VKQFSLPVIFLPFKDNDDGFEEFSNNFVLAERKFCELNAKMKSMGEREHSLLEQLSTLEQELATSKTNVTKLEEEKQKVPLGLFSSYPTKYF
jgi:hypothetical protein